MKINLKQHIYDYEGNPILVEKTTSDGNVVLDEKNRPVRQPEILRNYLVAAINNQAQNEVEPFTAEQKAKIYELSIKLFPRKGNEATLTLDDRAFLKERVTKIFGPLVAGRVADILEEKKRDIPNPNEVEEDEPKNAAE